MANLALDPVSRAYVLYDILNEPDGLNYGWDRMTDAYLDVIEQGQAINRGAPFPNQEFNFRHSTGVGQHDGRLPGFHRTKAGHQPRYAFSALQQ